MRRMFVVLALLAMMVGLRALQAETSGADPLTLAAIGFVVLAAFALAELGARASLPKVTGYILSGVVLGPFAVNIISSSVVGELKMFSTLALGLIATTAGLELDLRALARLMRTLGSTIGIKLVTGLVLVGGALVIFEQATGILGLGDTASIVALALVFAALSLGTSPAIVLAVETESGAKGRLSEIVLGAAVVKDVVVVIALAIALATGKAMLGGGELGGEVLLHVGEELGASVLGGALLGGLLIAYLRWVKTEMLLFVAAMVLVVAEISAVLHLELLLVFIVAGVVVRNFSPYEHDLLHPLQTISLPVFIVFFTNAGASIDLGATWALLPLALVLCTARAVGYFVAARVGGKIGNEPEPVRRYAWLGYLPQAGVTLGLVGLAETALPQLAEPIAALGMAVVAVNLLVGPITLRVALRGAGETSDATSGATEVPPATEDSPEPGDALPAELEAGQLRDMLMQLRDRLTERWAHWRDDQLRPQLEHWHRSLSTTEDERADEPPPALARRLVERIPAAAATDRAEVVRTVLSDQVEWLEQLPEFTLVPLEPRNARVGAGDRWRRRWAKRVATVIAALRGASKNRTRRVWTRMTARAVVEPVMARVAEQSLRSWQRHEARCLECIERVATGRLPVGDLDEALSGLRLEVLDTLRNSHRNAIHEVVHGLGLRWATEGAPGQARSARYSRVERELSSTMGRLEADAAAWGARRAAVVERLRFTAHSELVEHRVRTRLERDVIEPLDGAFERIDALVREQRRRLTALPRSEALTDDEAWDRVQAHIRALVPKPAAKELRALATRVRRATSNDGPGATLRSFMTDGTSSVTVVSSISALVDAERPAAFEIATVDARQLVEIQLAGYVLPQLEESLAATATAFVAARDQIHEVTSLLEFGLETASRVRAEGQPGTPFDEAIDRGDGMLEALLAGPVRAWEARRATLMEAIDGLAEQLGALLQAQAGGAAGAGAASMDRWASARVRLRRARERVLARAKELLDALRTGEVGQAAGDLALRYRLRAGLQRLDARAIATYLEDQRALRESKLTGLVGSLFSTEPLRDPRLLVFGREELAALVHAERAWHANPTTGNAALVVGGSGQGKSSMLGIARLKLGTRRVVNVRGPAGERDSLLGSLARALGVPEEHEAVRGALQRSPVVVVIDDLHRFFAPSPEGLEQLEQLISLIGVTQTHAFWLVAMADEAVRTWQALVPLDDAFPCWVQLAAPEPAELLAILEARRELGGQRCVYPRPRGLRARWLRSSPQQAYVRRLSVAASGNLRRALALWRAYAEPGEDAIVLRSPSSLVWRLPFIQQLREEAQATLSLLLHHGPQPAAVIADALDLTTEQAGVHLRFLVASALVVADGERYAVDDFVRDDLVLALQEAGAVEEGAS